MCSLETYYLIRSSAGSSHSFIERLVDGTNLPYKYRLNLETASKNIEYVDIYLTKDDLSNAIRSPLYYIQLISIDRITRTIKNRISPAQVSKYRFYDSISSFFIKALIDHFGCTVFLDLEYHMENQYEIIMEFEYYVKVFSFKLKLEELQPIRQSLSTNQADSLMILLSKITK